jgi:hypothetical protein
LIGPTIINNIVDSYVSPTGIAGIIRSGKASIPSEAQIKNSATDLSSVSTPDDRQLELKQLRYAFFSGGPLTFRVDIASDKAPSAGTVTLLFKWAGDWKLSRIFLPVDVDNVDNDTTEEKILRRLAHPREETQEEIQSRRDVDAKTTKGWRKDLSGDEIRALRARLAKLWKPPAGAKNPEELVVQIRFQLKQDGTVIGSPVVLTAGSSPLFEASRKSAVRAIMEGQPFNMLRPENYEAWKQIEITFDPRQKL